MTDATKPVWTPIKTASMDEKLTKLHVTYRNAAAAAVAAREAFNTAFTEKARKNGKVPAGHTLLISHKFGKSSVSLIREEDAKKPRKGGKAVEEFSL